MVLKPGVPRNDPGASGSSRANGQHSGWVALGQDFLWTLLHCSKLYIFSVLTAQNVCGNVLSSRVL